MGRVEGRSELVKVLDVCSRLPLSAKLIFKPERYVELLYCAGYFIPTGMVCGELYPRLGTMYRL